MPDTERRGHALIIANNDYEDERLRTLTSPQSDASALSRVLGDPQIGDFTVQTVINQPHYIVRREVDGFFRNRSRDDLLLLYFSGHGVKDEDGNLYLATTDTRRDWLSSTGVEAQFVHRAMERSLSRRQILILDCCYSGAFGRNLLAKSDDSIATGEQFGGRGRVVLTASDAVQFAFEGDAAVEIPASIFTGALVDGLETGAADLDRDGFIDVDEWYSFVHDRVTAAMPNQRPSKWSLDVRGSLIVARNRHADPVQIELPPELLEAMHSPFAGVREGSVSELAKLLDSHDARLVRAATLALRRLAEDDSRRVSAAALGVLGGGASRPATTAAGSSAADVESAKGDVAAGTLESPAKSAAPRTGSTIDQVGGSSGQASAAEAASNRARAEVGRPFVTTGANTASTAVRPREGSRPSTFRRVFLLYRPSSFGGGVAHYFYWFLVAPWALLVVVSGTVFGIAELVSGESLGFVLFSQALWITPNLLVMLILRHLAQRNRTQHLQRLAEVAPAPASASVTAVGCPSCGASVPTSALFCPGCDEPRTLIRTHLEAESRRMGVAYAELLRKMREDVARSPMSFDDWKARASSQTASGTSASSTTPGGR